MQEAQRAGIRVDGEEFSIVAAGTKATGAACHSLNGSGGAVLPNQLDLMHELSAKS